MKKITTLNIIIMLVFFFAACSKKEAIDFVSYPGQQLDSAWVTNVTSASQVILLGNSIAGQLNTDEVTAGVDASLSSNTGFTIQFPLNSLQQNGAVLTSGRVKVDYFLVQKKGDFIRYGVPTVSNRVPLETGGAMFIRMALNNQPVQITNGKKISIRYRDPEAKPNMSVYFGEAPVVTNSAFFNWAAATDGSGVMLWDSTQGVPPGSKGYLVETGRTGWVGVDRPLVPSAQKTEVSVIVPNLFSNANTAVYMVFSNYRTVVQLTGNPALRKFSFSNMPVGQDVKIIAISKVGDAYYLGQKTDKIVENMSTFVKPEQSSLASIISFLNSL